MYSFNTIDRKMGVGRSRESVVGLIESSWYTDGRLSLMTFNNFDRSGVLLIMENDEKATTMVHDKCINALACAG